MKNIAVVVIFIFSSLNSKAQARKIELGIRAGINLGSLYGLGTDFTYFNQNKKDFFGGVVGLQFRYRLSPRYALKTFIQLEQNAIFLHDITVQDPSSYEYKQGDKIYKQSYINMPILFERSFGNRVTFNFNGGLFLGVLVKDVLVTKVKQQFISFGQQPTNETFEAKKNNHKLFNLGLSFGTGVLLPVTKKIFVSINIQDNLGLMNIAKDYPNNSLGTNSISLMTGLVFPL